MRVDLQFNPAVNSWPVLRDATIAAERAGFDGAWVYDHLAGRSLNGTTMLEAFTLLGALAATTSTIELGTLVVNVAHREPAVVGVAAASVEAISGRHVFLGIGAGASPESRWAAELHAVGQPIEPTLAGRHARVERVLDVLDRMWSPDRDPELATFPLPRRRPTVVIGLNSVHLAELAGRRADGINVAWHRRQRDDLLTAAVAARGDRDGFLLTAWEWWHDELLDPQSARRREMASRDLDRLVLVMPGEVSPEQIAACDVR